MKGGCWDWFQGSVWLRRWSKDGAMGMMSGDIQE